MSVDHHLCVQQVVAAVYGPHEVGNRGDIQNDRAIVNVEVGSAAFARAAARRAGRTDRRAAEAARALKGALEQTIITELLPRSQVSHPTTAQRQCQMSQLS
jgi:ribonuclease PH